MNKRFDPEEDAATLDDDAEQEQAPLTPFAIMSAFAGAFQPVKTPFGYSLGLALAAITFMVLPIVYAALTAGTVFAVYWHAAHDWFVPHNRATFGALIAVYIAPLIAGVILVTFMLKPFFVLPRRREVPLYLDPKKQPLIFAFIREIAQSVKAPMPKKIAVTCDVNAMAGFRHGMWSMLVGGDLELYIGLPLAAGLSLRQFAGVLAHELGHFSQGSGMRLSYLARVGTRWFEERIVAGDSWDRKLNEWGQGEEDLKVHLVLIMARLMIWLARRVLWIIWMIGCLCVSFLMRKMEYHADRYSAHLVGSQSMTEALRRLPSLSVADHHAQNATFYGLLIKHLPNNLPDLILELEKKLTPEQLKQLDTLSLRQRTGLFSTHPGLLDRVMALTREPCNPIFTLDGPASALFNDFPALCRMTTRDLYFTIIGPQASRIPQSDAVAFLDMLSAPAGR